MKLALSLFAVLGVLVGCGGSDADGPDQTDSGTAEYYATYWLSDYRPLYLMRFEGGLVYGFYLSDYGGQTFPEFPYAGFFVAHADSPGPLPATYRGYEFDFDGKAKLPVQLDLLGVSGNWIDGAYKRGSDEVAPLFPSWYATVETDPTKHTLAGSYGGYVRAVAASSSVEATLDEGGTLALKTATGCRIEGKLTARPLGNLYQTEVTLGSQCPAPAGHYAGHAFQSWTRDVFIMLASPEAVDGVFFQLFAPRDPEVEPSRARGASPPITR